MNTEPDQSTISFEIASREEHFEQILNLQNENHYLSISEDQQKDDGFVFATHNLEVLKKMAAGAPQIVALAEGRVIGYNLSMNKAMKNDLPSLIPMFEEFNNWEYKGKPLLDYNFLVGGQVCVQKDYRGRGLIRQLYQHTRDLTSELYDLCVTEISVRNHKSLKAHQRMGFDILGTYNDGIENWNLVIWDWEK